MLVVVPFMALLVSVAISVSLAMLVAVPFTAHIVSVAIPVSIPMFVVGGPAVDDQSGLRAVLPLVLRSMKSAVHIAAVHGKMRIDNPCRTQYSAIAVSIYRDKIAPLLQDEFIVSITP